MRRAAVFLALVPSVALAQTAPGDTLAGSQYASLLPLVFIFAIFYFLLIRPQQKRIKEHQATIDAIVKGDEVVTGGGIVGKVTKVDAGDRFTVEIAKGVEVSVLKTTVTAVLGKPSAISVTPDKKKNPAVKNDNSAVSRDSIANDN